MVKEEKTGNPQVRVVIRVDIPKAPSDVAITLHAQINELVKTIQGATVEVTILPPIETR